MLFFRGLMFGIPISIFLWVLIFLFLSWIF
ncbi:hypothetical protein SAMN05877831_12221 [Rhodobacter maris]|uniref:Uncharacterized protein n=1 Tax=Rhodobacter maris TaxID=446682 RepID=A0A285TGN5_9RHOB|nr:hypothetical protein SAMN05877831_12221 [Rhodobacter maris]